MMDAERARRLEQLYQSALEHDESERRAFLESACGADLELRGEIESLLALDLEAGSFIEAPALEVAARPGSGRPPGGSKARAFHRQKQRSGRRSDRLPLPHHRQNRRRRDGGCL